MATPHKHAALIKAWADGATIQWQDSTGCWRMENQPIWRADTNYRIKPEPKPLGQVCREAWYARAGHCGDTFAPSWESAAAAVIQAYEERKNG